MWQRLAALQHEVMSHVYQMDRHHWMLAAAVVVVVGGFCLRGFGSRTDY